MANQEIPKPFEETQEGKPDPEKSQFRFTEEEKEKELKKMAPDKDTLDHMSQDVKNLLLDSKEKEIRERQDEDRDRVGLDELTETEEAGGK